MPLYFSTVAVLLCNPAQAVSSWKGSTGLPRAESGSPTRYLGMRMFPDAFLNFKRTFILPHWSHSAKSALREAFPVALTGGSSTDEQDRCRRTGDAESMPIPDDVRWPWIGRLKPTSKCSVEGHSTHVLNITKLVFCLSNAKHSGCPLAHRAASRSRSSSELATREITRQPLATCTCFLSYKALYSETEGE